MRHVDKHFVKKVEHLIFRTFITNTYLERKMLKNILLVVMICSVQLLSAQELAAEKAGDVVIMAPKIIPIGSSDYQRVKRYFDRIKSEEGTISYIPNRRSVLVYDTEEIITKMTNFSQKLFKSDRLMIKLKLEYLRVAGSKLEEEQFNPNWKMKLEKGRVIIPQITGFNTDKYPLGKSNKSEKFIAIFPGKTIMLAAGKPGNDIEQVMDFLMDPETVLLRGDKLFPFKKRIYPDKMRSILKMTTRIRKSTGRVELEIYPVLEMEIKGKKYALKVASLATKSQLRLNQQLAVGALLHTREEAFTLLFGENFFEEKHGCAIYDLCISTSLQR